MTRFIIFRHGQTSWNLERRPQGKRDIHLTQLGLSQAEKLGERLQSEKIDVFYSSPLSRSLETTKIVAKHHDKDVVVLDELIEMDFGIFEGKIKADRVALFPKFDVTNDEHRESMGMDRFDETIAVLKKGVIPSLLRKHTDQTVALGTHDQKMRALLVALGMPESIKGETLKNCTMTIVEIVNKNSLKIVCHNDNSHLTQQEGEKK